MYFYPKETRLKINVKLPGCIVDIVGSFALATGIKLVQVFLGKLKMSTVEFKS